MMYKPRFDPTIEIDKEFLHLPAFPRHHNERCVTVSPDGVLRIAGDFVDLSRNELIRSLNQQSVEFRHPQPVNMTPGALGVRCEE